MGRAKVRNTGVWLGSPGQDGLTLLNRGCKCVRGTGKVPDACECSQEHTIAMWYLGIASYLLTGRVTFSHPPCKREDTNVYIDICKYVCVCVFSPLGPQWAQCDLYRGVRPGWSFSAPPQSWNANIIKGEGVAPSLNT